MAHVAAAVAAAATTAAVTTVLPIVIDAAGKAVPIVIDKAGRFVVQTKDKVFGQKKEEVKQNDLSETSEYKPQSGGTSAVVTALTPALEKAAEVVVPMVIDAAGKAIPVIIDKAGKVVPMVIDSAGRFVGHAKNKVFGQKKKEEDKPPISKAAGYQYNSSVLVHHCY